MREGMHRRRLLEGAVGVALAGWALPSLAARAAEDGKQAEAKKRFAACIEACRKCAKECKACGECCKEEDGACCHTCIACHHCCLACAHLLENGSPNADAFRKVCAAVCLECAAACEKCGKDCCKQCAELCRACAKSCQG